MSTAIGDFLLALPQAVNANGTPLDVAAAPKIDGLQLTAPFTTASSAAQASSTDLPIEIAATSDLLFSTYLGGSGGEDGRSISVDGAGNVYVTGESNSANFPATPGVIDRK